MKKKILYTLLIIVLFQIIGYYTVGKRLLINDVIAQRQLLLDIGAFQSVKINSNSSLTEKHKSELKQLFREKEIRYQYFEDIKDIPHDSLFLEKDLNYTLDISTYIPPISVITVAESKSGFGADSTTLYVWVLMKWIKVKVISSGIS